jgi:hypothetical protein
MSLARLAGALLLAALAACTGPPEESASSDPTEEFATADPTPTVAATTAPPRTPTMTAAAPPPPTHVPPPQCVADIADAAAVNEFQDTLEDVWPAFESCPTLEDLTGAVEEVGGDRFEGVDPETYVRNGCEFTPELADTPLCRSLR